MFQVEVSWVGDLREGVMLLSWDEDICLIFNKLTIVKIFNLRKSFIISILGIHDIQCNE